MTADPLRAQLAALLAEMRAAHHGVWVEYWADKLAALLREPPEAAPLEIHAGLVEREGAFWKAVLFFAHESEARRALDLLNQHAARAVAPEES
jgi:hypothetical protein